MSSTGDSSTLHRAFLLLVATSGLIYLFGVAHLWTFTADDAYIVARYAENLVDHGALEFNLGERIAAFTSPLHVLLEAALYRLTGSSIPSYKVVALLAVLAAVALALRSVRPSLHGRSIVLVVLLLSPCVILWTFGGLETPLLFLLVTAITLAARGPEPPGLGRLCAVFVLAGLCLTTRYDSVLFTVPVVLEASLRCRSPKRLGLAAVAGAVLPVAWFLFAWRYYGDLMPTSFHVKMPGLGEVELLRNASYLAQYLTVVGLIPFFLLLAAGRGRRRSLAEVVTVEVRRSWGLYLGLVAMIGYGFWVATTHMLFSFRYFVPYLPAAALLLSDLYGEGAGRLAEEDAGHERPTVGFLAAALVLSLFQGYQIFHTYHHSMNGIVSVGEYLETGSKRYELGMMAMREELAGEIRRHWESRGGDGAPSIFTTAGGVLPYTYRDAHFLERLVSYRARCPRARARLAVFADYVHFVTPRHGKVSDRLAKPIERYELVASRLVVYDGVIENFVVFYDPSPRPSPLPARVKDACGP